MLARTLSRLGLAAGAAALHTASRPSLVARGAILRRGGATFASEAPSLKVYYWDMPFWRAEAVRMALFVGGVPFEDVRDKPTLDSMRAAGKLTFGALPVLEVDGCVPVKEYLDLFILSIHSAPVCSSDAP